MLDANEGNGSKNSCLHRLCKARQMAEAMVSEMPGLNKLLHWLIGFGVLLKENASIWSGLN